MVRYPFLRHCNNRNELSEGTDSGNACHAGMPAYPMRSIRSKRKRQIEAVSCNSVDLQLVPASCVQSKLTRRVLIGAAVPRETIALLSGAALIHQVLWDPLPSPPDYRTGTAEELLVANDPALLAQRNANHIDAHSESHATRPRVFFITFPEIAPYPGTWVYMPRCELGPRVMDVVRGGSKWPTKKQGPSCPRYCVLIFRGSLQYQTQHRHRHEE